MTYRQACLLFGLATDAKDLKVENGWYGDPRQGDSTQEEDEAAIEAMRMRCEVIRAAEDPQLVCGEFAGRLESVAITQERAKIAMAFYGAYFDGDHELMIEKLGELDGTITML